MPKRNIINRLIAISFFVLSLSPIYANNADKFTTSVTEEVRINELRDALKLAVQNRAEIELKKKHLLFHVGLKGYTRNNDYYEFEQSGNLNRAADRGVWDTRLKLIYSKLTNDRFQKSLKKLINSGVPSSNLSEVLDAAETVYPFEKQSLLGCICGKQRR